LAYSAGTGVAISDIIAAYDTSNLVGVVQLYHESQSTLEPNSSGTLVNYTATLGWGNAFMANASGNPRDIVDVTVNAGQFNHAGLGSYGYPNQDLAVYTGGGTYNKVRVVGDSIFGSKRDSLTFGSPVALTNITRGQNISRDSVVHLTWSGNGSGYVQVGILARDTITDAVGKGSWVGLFATNSGSINMTFQPVQLKKGLADVVIMQFEPKFITLSSGKRVCILCESRHVVSVYIID
jgi:hypothetical protein